MDWMKDNKFLAGFSIATAIGAIGLGFFLVSSILRYLSEKEAFENNIAQNQSLLSRDVKPTQSNFDSLSSKVAEYEANTLNLQKTLFEKQQPLPNLSRDNFGPKTLEYRDSLLGKAKQAKLKLPENFFFGMNNYQESSPSPEAAGLLFYQLDAINHLIEILIDSKIEELSLFEREPTAIEKSGTTENSKKTKKKKFPYRKGDIPFEPSTVLDAYRIRLIITSDHDEVQSALNSIIADKDYFYWIRQIRVESSKQAGGDRSAEAVARPVDPEAALNSFETGFDNSTSDFSTPGGEPATETVDPADPNLDGSGQTGSFADFQNFPEGSTDTTSSGPMIDAMFVFGDEKIKVSLEVDLIRFKPAEMEE